MVSWQFFLHSNVYFVWIRLDWIRLDQIRLDFIDPSRQCPQGCAFLLKQRRKHKHVERWQRWILFSKPEWNTACWRTTFPPHFLALILCATTPRLASAPPSSPAPFVSNKPASCSRCPPVADTLSQWGEMLILTPSVKPEPCLFISEKIHSLHHSGWFTCKQTSCHHRPPSLYFVCAAVVLSPPENNITSLSCASLPSVFIADSFPDSAHRGARRRNPEVRRRRHQRGASEKVTAAVGVRSFLPTAILLSPPPGRRHAH